MNLPVEDAHESTDCYDSSASHATFLESYTENKNKSYFDVMMINCIMQFLG